MSAALTTSQLPADAVQTAPRRWPRSATRRSASPGASLVVGVALPVDGGFTAH
jgi:hypothetical protein